MSEHNNHNSERVVEIKITQDKLVDILMHAATRDDIARLDSKINELDKKIDSKFSELDNKIDKLDTKFDSKFNELDRKFDSKFNELDRKFDFKINELDKKIDSKFTLLITFYGVGFMTLLGVMAKGFHWF